MADVDVLVLFIVVGMIAWFVNFFIARMRKWIALEVLNLACLLPIAGVLVLEGLFGKTGFFGAIVIFMTLGFIMFLTFTSTVALVVLSITSKVSEKQKVES